MLTKKNPKMAGLVLVGTATLVLAGCSMGGSTTAAETMEPTMAPSASEESMETEAAMDPAFDNLVGAVVSASSDMLGATRRQHCGRVLRFESLRRQRHVQHVFHNFQLRH